MKSPFHSGLCACACVCDERSETLWKMLGEKSSNYQKSQTLVEWGHRSLLCGSLRAACWMHHINTPVQAVNEPSTGSLKLWPQLQHSLREEIRWLLADLIELWMLTFQMQVVHIYGSRCLTRGCVKWSILSVTF